MTKRLLGAVLVGGALLCAAPARAAVIIDIDFSEPPYVPFDTDPLIEGVQFSAGDPSVFSDTYIDDAFSSGNPYLVSGYNDKTPPATGVPVDAAYIAATGGGGGGAGKIAKITLDAGFVLTLPVTGLLDLTVEALLGGVVQGAATLSKDFNDTALHQMAIELTDKAFDEIRLYGKQPELQYFRIDNLLVDVTDKPTPPGPVPAPGTLVLVALGLAGMRAARRRR
jgi:hypothetical protein